MSPPPLQEDLSPAITVKPVTPERWDDVVEYEQARLVG